MRVLEFAPSIIAPGRRYSRRAVATWLRSVTAVYVIKLAKRARNHLSLPPSLILSLPLRDAVYKATP